MDAKNPQSAALRASVSIGPDPKTSTTALPAKPIIIDRQIIISCGLNNLFMVSVEPSVEAHPPMIFDSHKQARGYAGGLRLCHRWQIVDQTGGAK